MTVLNQGVHEIEKRAAHDFLVSIHPPFDLVPDKPGLIGEIGLVQQLALDTPSETKGGILFVGILTINDEHSDLLH